MAQTSTETVRHLSIVPVVTIQHSEFAMQYEYGLARSLFETHEPHPLPDLYLADRFMHMRTAFHSFDKHHQEHLYATFGFALGEIHGRVLSSSDGAIHPAVTTLVTLHDEEVTRGYRAGRDFYFLDADTEQEWHLTEDRLLQWLRELAQDYSTYHDAERTVRFCIGCILGELSGCLFPWTAQEQRAFEEESIRLLGYVCRINPRSLAARQFGVQVVS